MAISTIDDVVTALAASSKQKINFFKNCTAAKAIGSYQSAWMATGSPAAGAASPTYTTGSGYTASSATTGAMPYTNAATQNYLARANSQATLACSLIIADRLWSCSGMGFAAATYTVTTPGSLPARITDNGLGCELWVEQFVAAGAASGTLTANYVDSASGSVAGVISAVVSAPVTGQLQPVPLANNLGVKQLTSVVTSATWTSGSFGMTILKRVVEIPLVLAGIGGVLDYAQTALARIPADACLFGFISATSTTAVTLSGSLDIIDK
jgi:hypothetical protein